MNLIIKNVNILRLLCVFLKVYRFLFLGFGMNIVLKRKI